MRANQPNFACRDGFFWQNGRKPKDFYRKVGQAEHFSRKTGRRRSFSVVSVVCGRRSVSRTGAAGQFMDVSTKNFFYYIGNFSVLSVFESNRFSQFAFAHWLTSVDISVWTNTNVFYIFVRICPRLNVRGRKERCRRGGILAKTLADLTRGTGFK